jgi:hypothetical protein
MIDDRRLERTLAHIVGMLVRGDYAGLEDLSGRNRLHAVDLEDAVKTWGRTLALPPNGNPIGADVVPIAGSDPSRWSVWLPLWTAEEGRSDLTLELTLVDGEGPEYGVEIDNLEVP